MRQLATLLRLRHGGMRLVPRLRRLLLPLMIGSISFALRATARTRETHLTIEVRLTQHVHGALAYLIFPSASGFPSNRDKALRRGFLPVPQNAQQLRIEPICRPEHTLSAFMRT
jgi:uncharacterized protein (DUF2141 family)